MECKTGPMPLSAAASQYNLYKLVCCPDSLVVSLTPMLSPTRHIKIVGAGRNHEEVAVAILVFSRKDNNASKNTQ
ncbi:hypothetical protein Ddc_09647 [Ditylenchus destructor]|nr:hypothetical protein Ddc_09647 [Ditylenchus destructor]